MGWCSAFCRCFAVLWQRSCAALGCGSSRVAASGGQGGIGGLRVPPTPSLDSLLTPLYRRRSAEGLEAAERCVLARRSAVVARYGVEVLLCVRLLQCCIAALFLCTSPYFPRESARGPSGPLVLYSNPAACTPGSRQFLRRGACPPEKKLLPIASEWPGGRPAARPMSECIIRPSDIVTWAKRSGGGACSPATCYISATSTQARRSIDLSTASIT